MAGDITLEKNVPHTTQSLIEFWNGTPSGKAVLILDGLQNGILEEILVLAYLLRRLDQLGWSPASAIALSAVLRGSYHLYQGFGGFLGNAVMGVVFAWWFRRTRRLWPLVIAHSLLDIFSFAGYALLKGSVSWLP